MNKLFVMSAAAVIAATVFAEDAKTVPLAEARAQIGSVVGDASAMTALVKSLSAADQVAFLADVNAAIAKMPGSNEEKAARALNANSAALKGAAKGNLANMLAEVFATATPEALTVINERFAADLFSRSADPSRTYTDEQFTDIATNMMAKIESRTAGSDDSGVRNAFAALMLVRASEGGPANLADTLVATFPDQATRDLASSEWLPAALGSPANYDAMLGYSDAGAQPNTSLTLQLAGPQVLDGLLTDLANNMTDADGNIQTPFLDQAYGGFADPFGTGGAGDISIGSGAPPRTTDPTKPWYPGYRRGQQPSSEPEPEPQPYRGQQY